MSDIEIEIDGKKLTVKPNQTVIQVADDAGIYIPRFCYHKHLTIPANCRMCLVEVEKAPKVLPACATPVAPGMKVFTKSARTIAAQRAVMEFLLINHPLDCPICDQGGECELQDLSLGYGAGWSHYDETKRAVADQDLGPLIATEMTRCIYCTRCVRFGEELAGLRELGAIGRGEFTEISTYIQHAMHSEVSGNIIDLCPVGALTSKPYRFTGRPWELDQAPSISPHDCLGSNINVHTRYGKVMRIVSRENNAINETWISDRDRFSYTALYHEDRLQTPMAKINGTWQDVDWEQALYLAAKGLQEITRADPTQLGALASPSATIEEFYVLQKIVRALGSPHIDTRLQEIDTSDQNDLALFPGITVSLSELESCDGILLIGSNLQKEQPLAALRVRKAVNNGASVIAINNVDYRFSFALAGKKIVAPAALPDYLANDAALKELLSPLNGKKKIAIILGASALNHPRASVIRYYAQELATKLGASLSFMTAGANTAGAFLAGAVPHRLPGGKACQPGFSAYEMLEANLAGYLLLNVEPDLDCANAGMANAAIKNAKFTVSLSIFKHPSLLENADILLPIAPFTETAGTYVNVYGTSQTFQGVAKPYKEARPGWKVLRALANFLNLDGFNYESVTGIREELHQFTKQQQREPLRLKKPESFDNQRPGQLSRIGDIPIYAADSLVRRSLPLQKVQEIIATNLDAVVLHPETAKKLAVVQDEIVLVSQKPYTAKLAVRLDSAIAPNAAFIAGGRSATRLGDLFGDVEIRKINSQKL